MYSLFSLVDPPPTGFELVAAYQRRAFRRRAFALFAATLEQAEQFLGSDLPHLTGVLVTVVGEEPGLAELRPGLYHMRLRPERVAIVSTLANAVLPLVEQVALGLDRCRAADLELERALLNQQRMADEFETIRSSLTREIAERRATEARLRESERRARALFDLSFELVGLLTPDGRITEVNGTTLRFARTTADQVRGRFWWEAPAWKHSPEVRAEIRRAVERGAAGEATRFETTFVDPAGERHTMDCSINPVFDEHGEVAFLIPEAWDITDRKRAEELRAQLVQTQRLESVGRLAGGIAHDFNNMLGVILGRAELALLGVAPDSSPYEDLQEILRTAERSSQLTRQLLAFARRQTINPKALDLNDAVASTLSMLRRLVGETIELQWHPGEGLGKVMVDAGQLDQVLANLVVNARDAMNGAGVIALSTSVRVLTEPPASALGNVRAGEFVALSVRDTGAGIAPELREHIFEPFFTTKGVGKGTGLGLAIVLGVAEQHDGFVEVTSAPGQGAEFVICLPRAADATATSAAPPGPAPVRGTETVLVVEDEEAVLALAVKLLTGLGYRVLPASGPDEALRLFDGEGEAVDLLLTDVVMPGMNGRELAEQLTRRRPGLKCLFMSGHNADVISHGGVLDEGVSFIPKPFGVADIARKIREVLDRG